MEPTFAVGPPTEGPVDTEGPFRLTSDRTALQIPIVVAGEVGRMLRVIWHERVATDRPETLVLARRLADHAGLALEHAERRRAQEAADRSADDTRRLLDATEALAAATTPELVGAAALEEAQTTLGAAAGSLLRLSGDDFVLVASSGFAPEELVGWERFDRGTKAPLGTAVARNELLVHRTRAELAVDYPELAAVTRFGAWLSIPLSVAGQTIGAIGLSFAEGRTFRPADLEYVESLARQTGLALDRTLLLEDEQRARARAEQLASDLSRLHAFATALGAATSTSEVGTLVCEQVKSILGASACAVYVPFESDQFQLLHGTGSLTPGLDPTPDGPTWPACLDAALNPASSLWLATVDDWNGAEPYGVLRTPDGLAVAVVPLAAGGQPSGLLVAWFSTDEFPEESGKRLLETMVRQATQPLERVRLLESEREARLAAQTAAQRTRTLHEVAERMSRAVTPRDVAEVVRSSLAGLLAAETVEVFKLDEARGRAELLAPGTVRPAPVVGLDALELTMPRADRPPDEEPRSRYAYPLASGVRTPGAVRLTFDVPVAIDDESASMVQAITRQGGQALDRSLLFEDEQRARTRTERLQALTAAFSRALTLEDVATVFVDDALVGLRADGVTLGVIVGDEREVRPLALARLPDEVVDRPLLAASSSHPTPASVAAREGSASYFETGTQLGARYPELDGRARGDRPRDVRVPPRRAPARGAARRRRRSRGAAGRSSDDDAWSFLQALTTQCGLALDRARALRERSASSPRRSSGACSRGRSRARGRPRRRALPARHDRVGRRRRLVRHADAARRAARVRRRRRRRQGRAARRRRWPSSGTGCGRSRSTTRIPAETMTKLNRLLEAIHRRAVRDGRLPRRSTRHARTATLVSAGHLPPLVIEPSGDDAVRSRKAGTSRSASTPSVPLEAADVSSQPGSLVVLYTDGLVERSRPVDRRGARPRSPRSTVPADRDPRRLADTILERAARGRARCATTSRSSCSSSPARRRGRSSSRCPPRPRRSRRCGREVARLARARRVPADRRAGTSSSRSGRPATNAIEHGQPRPAARCARRRRSSATASGSRSPTTGSWQEPREREDRGLGLRVIRSLMTDVELEQSGTGTRVVMERSVTRGRPGTGRPAMQTRTDRSGRPDPRPPRRRAGQAHERRGAERARPARSAAGDLLVDLTDVTFLDSAGLHVLFRLARAQAEAGATLGVVVPTRARSGGWSRSPTSRALPVCTSVDEGVLQLRNVSLAPRVGYRRVPSRRRRRRCPHVVSKKGTKRARQYEHIKESLEEQGRSESTAEEIAARTVNKERARHGEAATSSRLSREDISSGRRGGLRSGTEGPARPHEGAALRGGQAARTSRAARR